MRVVICDDHLLLLEALATALANRGITVEAATTSQDEAIRAVALHRPDVLLIDLTFPSGSGLDAARQVLERHPPTKVVMITGADAPEALAEALAIGVSGYVLKDQRVDEICAALEVAARGEMSVHRSLLRQIKRTAEIPPQRSGLEDLTPREHHVLQLMMGGMDTRQIVQQLGVSQSTVRTHVQSILSKLGVHSRLQAVAALAEASAGHEERAHGSGH